MKITAAAIVALLILFSCSDGLPPEFPAPDFSIEDVFSENAVAYSEHKGKPLILYFFASW